MANSYKEELKTKKYISSLLSYVEIVKNTHDKDLDNAIVQCKNGKIFAVFAFDILSDKMDSRISEERSEAYKNFFSSKDSNFSFVFDTVKTRKQTNYEVLENITLPNVKTIEDKMKDFYENEVVIFETKLYLSVIMNIKRSDNSALLLTEKHIAEFSACISSIEGYKETLGLKGSLLKGDDLYTYLVQGATNNFYLSHLSVPFGSLDKCIANESEFYPSIYPLKIDDNIHICMSLKNDRAYTSANMYFALMNIPVGMRMIIKYNPLSKKETAEYLYKKKSEFKMSMFRLKANLQGVNGGGIDEDEVDYSSLTAKNECDNALSHIEEDNVNGGYYSFNIILSSTEDNEEQLLELTRYFEKVASENHLSLKREKRNNTFSFFSSVSIAENKGLDYNRTFAISDNVGDFIYTSGNNDNLNSPFLEEITGSKIPFMLSTRVNNSVYAFSPFGSGEVGHIFITGQTGSGKSITLAHFGNEWLKYKNTKLVYLDVGLSMLNTVLSNGGKVFCPPLDKTTFAPFHNAKDHIDHIIAFVESIAVANSIPFTPVHTNAVKRVCEILPYGKENTETFFALLQNELGQDDPLVLTIYQYVDTLGNGIFNATEDNFNANERVLGIELEKLLIGQSKKLVYPALTFIFNRLETMFDPKTPTMLILDEAWLFLKDEFFTFYIQNWLKTLRKKNALVIIATQEIQDLTASPIASTILSSCSHRIFIRNTHSMENTFYPSYQALGLEDYQINTIRYAPPFHSLIVGENVNELVNFQSSVILDNLKTTDKMKKDFLKSIS